MQLIVLGRVATVYAAFAGPRAGVPVGVVADESETGAKELAERLGATGWTADPLAILPGPEDAIVVLGSDVARADELARMATTAGRAVVLPDVPAGEEQAWTEIASRPEHHLILSRPLRFDRLFATAKAAIRAGDVGKPRTVQIAWTFGAVAEGAAGSPTLAALATELADVALWLLDDAPSAVYAVACAVEGPPLIQVNLQTRTGSLALLEASVASPGLPRFRDLSLQASDGAIYHRAIQDDSLWTSSGVEVLSYADDALAREVAAWAGQTSDAEADLARGQAVMHNLAVTRAIAVSLTSGEPVSITTATV
jgi:predicted dehydrogenase